MREVSHLILITGFTLLPFRISFIARWNERLIGIPLDDAQRFALAYFLLLSWRLNAGRALISVAIYETRKCRLVATITAKRHGQNAP